SCDDKGRCGVANLQATEGKTVVGQAFDQRPLLLACNMHYNVCVVCRRGLDRGGGSIKRFFENQDDWRDWYETGSERFYVDRTDDRGGDHWYSGCDCDSAISELYCALAVF